MNVNFNKWVGKKYLLTTIFWILSFWFFGNITHWLYLSVNEVNNGWIQPPRFQCNVWWLTPYTI